MAGGTEARCSASGSCPRSSRSCCPGASSRRNGTGAAGPLIGGTGPLAASQAAGGQAGGHGACGARRCCGLATELAAERAQAGAETCSSQQMVAPMAEDRTLYPESPRQLHALEATGRAPDIDPDPASNSSYCCLGHRQPQILRCPSRSGPSCSQVLGDEAIAGGKKTWDAGRGIARASSGPTLRLSTDSEAASRKGGSCGPEVHLLAEEAEEAAASRWEGRLGGC